MPHWVKKILLMQSYSLKTETKKTFTRGILDERTYPVLKRPIISLKEYDYLMDSYFDLTSHKANQCTDNQLKLEKQIIALLKIIKLNFKKIDDEQVRTKRISEIIIEWKEAARRIENIFFLISLLTIISAPIILFGKFYIRDITAKGNSVCGCLI